MGVVGTAWALDAVSGAPSYTGRVLRQTNSAALAGATSARPFGGISGVRPGTSVTTVTATSTTWTAQTFAGVIDLEASALSGAYEFAFNLVTSGSVTASNASNPRIDILSVRIDDPAEGDGSSVPAVTMVYTAGTATGSPVAPAAPARSFAVAQLNFPAGSGTTPTVTWVAPYTVAAGASLPVLTLAQLTAISGSSSSPFAEVFADPNGANGTYKWNGSAWKAWESDWISYTSTLGNAAVGTGGSALKSSDYRYEVGRLRLRFRAILGTSGASVTSTPTWTVPSGVSLRTPATANELIDGRITLTDISAASNYIGHASYIGTDVDKFRIIANAATTVGTAGISATSPFTWAAGDVISGEVVVDVA